jgi:hypothetical protein
MSAGADLDLTIRDLLICAGERPGPGIRPEILRRGPAAVEPLIEVLRDERLAELDAPGDGWAPIHAAQLLLDLGAVEAIEPLLTAFVRSEWGDLLHDLLLQGLPKLGPAVVPPALARLELATDPAERSSLLTMLAIVRPREERVLERLLAELDVDPSAAASGLIELDDPRALPRLLAAAEAWTPEGAAGKTNSIFELVEAIEHLGGQLTPAVAGKLRRAYDASFGELRTVEEELDQDDDLLDEAQASSAPVAAPWRQVPNVQREAPRLEPVRVEKTAGRNDPCPCGSGTKYKKCCLG